MSYVARDVKAHCYIRSSGASEMTEATTAQKDKTIEKQQQMYLLI